MMSREFAFQQLESRTLFSGTGELGCTLELPQQSNSSVETIVPQNPKPSHPVKQTEDQIGPKQQLGATPELPNSSEA